MVKEFKLPDLGEGIEGGDVVTVNVSQGDTVSAEQTIAEVETDKAVLEVPCPFAGKVTEVLIKQGDHVTVGTTLLKVDTDGEPGGDDQDQQSADSDSDSEPKSKSESESKSDSESEPNAPAESSSQKKAEESDQPDSPSPSKAESASRSAKGEPSDTTAKGDEPIPAGPATRRLARELGVDLNALAEAHPGKRITEAVIKEHVRSGSSAGASSAGATTAVPRPELPDFTQWGEIEKVPFSSLQRKTAANLLAGWSVAPHVTQFDMADITALEALRKRFRETEQAKDVRLTVTAFILKAVAITLKTYPQFNASLDDQTNELILKKYYHLGMAVDTEAGLIVPVLRDVDRKSVLTIAKEMNEIAERTRSRKIALDELRGGTFTVTNLGGIGGTAFTPIINYPEVAILGLARSRQEPMIVDGELKVRLMLPLCLSYDHRVVNGADGARFVRKLTELLQDPEMLLLGA